MTTTKTAPNADDTGLFETVDVVVRGQAFRFRELSAAEYDKCVENATDKDGVINTVQLMRWMIHKGSVEPKLTLEQIVGLPFGVVTAISEAVNNLHFRAAPEDATHECPKCKADVLDSAEFCSACGEKQPVEADAEGNEKRPNS